MDLGTRTIRSAGRTSGSIEITLPVKLQVLKEVACRLSVRDGPRPEIVLQPDISSAVHLFELLWQKLELGLAEVGELGDFSPADFTARLFPARHWHARPPLAYSDALTVLRLLEARDDRGPEALARLLASLAMVAGQRLGLEGALALAFGDAVAYLITGWSAGLGTDFERGMAHRTFLGAGRASHQPTGSPFDDEVWLKARSSLVRVYDKFRAWQDDPAAYATERRKWYWALTVESEAFAAAS